MTHGPPAALVTFVEAEAEPRRVAVLPVAIQGELPASAIEQMRSIIIDNLSADGVEVVEATAVDDALAPDSACEDTECLTRVAEQLGADYLLTARIEGDEDEFSVTVGLVDGSTGEPLVPFEGECSICGFVEVRDLVRMRTLDARAEVIRRAQEEAARPSAESAPAPAVDRPATRSPLIPAGWGLVGAGAAAVVGGVVLLALHRRSAGCLDNPRGGDCVPVRYTTAPAGGGVLAGGVLAAAGGVVMVVLGRRAEQPPRSQVSIGPRGVAWRLRF